MRALCLITKKNTVGFLYKIILIIWEKSEQRMLYNSYKKKNPITFVLIFILLVNCFFFLYPNLRKSYKKICCFFSSSIYIHDGVCSLLFLPSSSRARYSWRVDIAIYTLFFFLCWTVRYEIRLVGHRRDGRKGKKMQ